MRKINYVIAIVLGILVGMAIEQNNTINSLKAVNESVEICCDNEFCHEYAEEEIGTFWCQDCETYYNEFCEGCGKDEELWDMYCDEYVLMNYCEKCDLCYYAVCNCTESYYGEDYETFVYDYEYYLTDYCTNYCEDCDEYYYYFCAYYDDSDYMMYLEDMHNDINRNQE